MGTYGAGWWNGFQWWTARAAAPRAPLNSPTDEPPALGIEGQDRRGPSELTRRGFALEEEALLDKVIDIDPDG